MMKAVVVSEKGKAKIAQVPKPAFGPDEIFVQVKAVGVNPTDWKHVKFVSPVDAVIGCDFAGVIAAVGSDVTEYAIGDRVAGFIHGGDSPNAGSYAEFTPANPKATFKLPDYMSFEEAAAFPVSAGTAAIALFQHLGLQSPENPYKENRPKLLVWGASSYAGIFAIQLAKLAGVSVVATASPHSWSLLQSLGADAVFDYRDSEVSKKILHWAGGELVYGLDCISEESTVPIASNSMTGGTLVLLLSGAISHPDNNKVVQLKPMLLYTALGKEFTKFGTFFPASPEDYKWGCWWWKLCANLVKKGQLRAPRLKKIGGLEHFEEAFQLLIENKVKAEKCILNIESK
jgi:NADPH:quinone reductase-like Zn-dependent oxidoreductase